MKQSRNWTGRGFYLKLGLAAASFAVLTGCARFSEVTSRIPVMTLQMDARYMNGTDYQKALMLYEKGLLLEARSKAREVASDDAEYRYASRLITSINSVAITIAREHKELGETYDRAGIYEKAAYEYRQSLKYNPLNAKLSRRVAEFDAAVREKRRPESFVSSLNPAPAEPQKKPVTIAQPATKQKEKLPDTAPENKADAHYTRGKTYLEAEEYARAEGEFTLALSFVPDYLNAREMRDISVKERKKAVETHLRNGISYFQDEEMELAIKEWETVLRFDPNNDDAKDYKYRAEIILERLRNIRGQQAGELGKPL